MISLKYDWEHDYVAAMIEEDDAELRDRISSAELAIENRLEVLKGDHPTQEEVEAIVIALAGLEKLRLQKLGEGRTRLV